MHRSPRHLGEGLDGGNSLTFPGYIGPNYQPEFGLMCVAHVHREPENEADLIGDPRRFMAAHKTWKRAERSETTDAAFLAEVRRYYKAAASTWGPWRRSFGPVVEDALEMDLSQVVYANLAKCRQQLGKGSAETLAVLPAAVPCRRACQGSAASRGACLHVGC
jgi:hypothetical protein